MIIAGRSIPSSEMLADIKAAVGPDIEFVLEDMPEGSEEMQCAECASRVYLPPDRLECKTLEEALDGKVTVVCIMCAANNHRHEPVMGMGDYA